MHGLADFARLAAWVALVFAVWAAAAGLSARRMLHANLAVIAWRGMVAAVTAASIALAVLCYALAARDYDFAFAAERASAFMPAKWLPAALLSATGGATLAWAVLVGAFGLAALGRVRRATALDNGRPVTVVAASAVMAVTLAVAIASRPFATTFGAVHDGAVLSPDLQQVAPIVVALGYLTAAAASVVSLSLTAGALDARALDLRWSGAARRWNAIAWTALVAGVVASARWYAGTPLRGDWATDPATSLWLLPCAIGAWLIHLDAARPTADRVVTRLLLIFAMAAAAAAALAFGLGIPVHGIAAHANPAGRWLVVIPLGVALAAIALLRRAAGAAAGATRLPAPSRNVAAAWLAHAGGLLVLGAIVGARFTRSYRIQLADTAIFTAHDQLGRQWTFTGEGQSTSQRENYAAVTWALAPARNGVRGPVLTAEARAYASDSDNDEQGAVQVAYAGSVARGVFLETRVSVVNPDASPAVLRVSFVPLGTWLVPGALFILAGSLIPAVRIPEERVGRSSATTSGLPPLTPPSGTS